MVYIAKGLSTPKMITLKIENNTDKQIDKAIFEQVLAAITEENIRPNAEIALLLTDDDTVQELNRKYRGKNSKTDVLTFSSQIPNLPFLGDIIIDTSTAESQKGSWSLEEELQQLFLHGVLHLLGYDHISAKQKKVMNEKENRYRKILKNIKLGE